jgi:glycosyltransferase involved in cell wall biosynthesis
MDCKINYSIIIPHKNIPKLLERCLASIPYRDDLQVIVVDDNSDPEKVDFRKFPGIGCTYIEVVFTKEGKGAGYARNVGLTRAIGKWVLFADADDFFNYCIDDVFDEYINSEADIIFFKCNSVDSNEYTTTYRNIEANTFIDCTQYSQPKSEKLLKYRNTVVWAKIFSANFINQNNILFDEISSSNDVTFAYLAGFYAKSIRTDSRALYCVTRRQDSLSYTKKSFEKKKNLLYVNAKRYRFFHEQNIPNKRKIVFMYRLSALLLRGDFFDGKKILLDLGFTKIEIVKLYICTIIFYLPIVICYVLEKLFCKSNLLTILFLR